MFDSMIGRVVAFAKANKVFLSIVGLVVALVAVQNACGTETVAEEVETSTERT